MNIIEEEAIKDDLYKRGAYPVEKYFPNAKFFPWDEPQIGMRVVDNKGRTGVVIGRMDVLKHIHQDVCSTCSCEKIISIHAGWWKVKLDDPRHKDPVLLYPPQLQIAP